jgi:hypothetical protein
MKFRDVLREFEGMELLLKAQIEHVQSLAKQHPDEIYLRILARDLQTALDNYKQRYVGLPLDGEPVTTQFCARLESADDKVKEQFPAAMKTFEGNRYVFRVGAEVVGWATPHPNHEGYTLTLVCNDAREE